MSEYEFYTQDEETVTVRHVGREDYRLSCSCGEYTDRAVGETQANSRAMWHVFEHDVLYEDSLMRDD